MLTNSVIFDLQQAIIESPERRVAVAQELLDTEPSLYSLFLVIRYVPELAEQAWQLLKDERGAEQMLTSLVWYVPVFRFQAWQQLLKLNPKPDILVNVLVGLEEPDWQERVWDEIESRVVEKRHLGSILCRLKQPPAEVQARFDATNPSIYEVKAVERARDILLSA